MRLWPHVANSGNLYSVEFFAECARARSATW